MTTEQAPPAPNEPAANPPVHALTHAAAVALDIDALPPRELYANREISWLDFNDRVFAEAMDPRNPLRERVQFLAIAASNLDEFYAKRLGWLQSRLRSGHDEQTVDGLSIREQLNIVRERGATMRHRYAACWRDQLAPGLAGAGVPVSSYAALSPVQRARVREYFVRDVFPVLTPLVVDPAHPFPFISGGSLSIGANVTDPETGDVRFARIKVPDNRPRFVDAGDGVYVAIEELIGAHLDLLFPGAGFSDWWLMHVLRNADIDAPDEATDDLREVVGTMIERRRMAAPVCVELSADPSGARGHVLRRELGLSADDVLVLPSPCACPTSPSSPPSPPRPPRSPPPPRRSPAPSARPPPATRSSRRCARAACWSTTPTSRSTPASPDSSAPRPATPACSQSSRRCTAPHPTRPCWRPRSAPPAWASRSPSSSS